MPLVKVFENVTENTTIDLSELYTGALPSNQLIGVYISGTLDGADVLTQVNNPANNTWATIEDLSWRADPPDGSDPLPPNGTDGATYLVVSWQFRFQLANAGASTNITFAFNWG